ncbi:MAG TPA: ABC transporter permease [Candidatus Xenobia bacterium]|nr:ABC transporter permease [Candidatus Xenobia bacterium]
MSVYRARYLDWQLPERLAPGEEATLRVSLLNNSGGVWLAQATNGQVPVFLSYHWTDHRGRYTVYDGLRSLLPADVPPGDRVEVHLRVRVPRQPGQYVLEISPLQENVAWFHDKGVEPLRLQFWFSPDGGYRVRRMGSRRLEALRATLAAPFVTLYRERRLLWAMAVRDMMGRYKGTLGGALWAVLNPLLMIITYTFLFSSILKVRFGPQGSLTDFAFYFIAGFLPWLAFSDPVVRSQSVIVENSNFVKRVVFPIEILPANLVLSAFLTNLIGLGLFLLARLLFGHMLPAIVLLLPLVMLCHLAFTLGLAWFLASAGVFLRDIGQVVSVLLTLWFFLTPICYPEASLTPDLRALLAFNPFFHIVRAYRLLLLEGTLLPVETAVALLGFSLPVFFFGAAWFWKTRKAFADVL